MVKIRLIDGFEKIAAGEVIERPASVVKELVENSIDSGASRIQLVIEKAGKNLIQIIDNGSGIEESDVEIAFQRHTSSKISSADQLEDLSTLGFRGEALASIAAISQIELISRPSSQDYAIKLVLKEGKIIEKEKIGAPIGTSIKIMNLFFNLPVRKKFMRSDKVELGHITDIITRYSLAYPLLQFKLDHNNLTLINSPGFKQPTEKPNSKKVSSLDLKIPIEAYGYSIQTIYGKRTLDKMVPIFHENGDMTVYGYVGLPEIGRSDRNAASLFVNKRLVTNNAISQIMDNVFKDYLMKQKHPFFVLFIEISPSKVDFNIHPSKKIVKFLDETELFNQLQIILNKIVHENLQKTLNASISSGNSSTDSKETIIDYWTPTSNNDVSNLKNNLPVKDSSKINLSFNEDSPLKSNTSKIFQTHSSPSQNSITKVASNNSNSNSKTKIKEMAKPNIQTRISSSNSSPSKNSSKFFGENSYNSQNNLSTATVGNSTISVSKLPELTFLNSGIQAGKTYLFFQNDEGVVIIDQHAADERINYEKVQKMFKDEQVPIQQLVIPLKMDVSLGEIEFVKEAIPLIKKYGFDLEFFGGSTFIIRTIPAFIKNQNSPTLITDLCLEIIRMGSESSISDIRREIIQYMACHRSLRGGDELWSKSRILRLIQELDQCENPHHCAHGRPTYIKFSYVDLEKMFHRRV